MKASWHDVHDVSCVWRYVTFVLHFASMTSCTKVNEFNIYLVHICIACSNVAMVLRWYSIAMVFVCAGTCAVLVTYCCCRVGTIDAVALYCVFTLFCFLVVLVWDHAAILVLFYCG